MGIEHRRGADDPRFNAAVPFVVGGDGRGKILEVEGLDRLTMKGPRRAKQRERPDDALSHSTMVMIKDYTLEPQGASNLFGTESGLTHESSFLESWCKTPC